MSEAVVAECSKSWELCRLTLRIGDWGWDGLARTDGLIEPS